MDQIITMSRGNTLSFGIEIEDLEQDLSGAYFSCKADLDDDEYIFNKTLGDGITKVATGQYIVRVAPADTLNIEPKEYFYALRLEANGDAFTVLKGILVIEDDATR